MTDVMEILLVEDSAEDVELTLRALRRHNLANKVHTVTDGVEALDYLATAVTMPRVILLDLKLPKLTGLQVLERLRADARTRLVPVVMLTSSREGPDVERAYALGANSYIVKPVEFDAFVRAVSDIGLYWLLLNQPPDP